MIQIFPDASPEKVEVRIDDDQRGVSPRKLSFDLLLDTCFSEHFSLENPVTSHVFSIYVRNLQVVPFSDMRRNSEHFCVPTLSTANEAHPFRFQKGSPKKSIPSTHHLFALIRNLNDSSSYDNHMIIGTLKNRSCIKNHCRTL